MRRSAVGAAMLASAAVASVAAPAIKRAAQGQTMGPTSTRQAWRERVSNHAGFTHDSLASLGYDWGRVADPAVAPRHPLKVYLPRTTAEVARLLREARALGERPVVRSKGHSSNDLVLADRGSVLLTERLDQIIGLDQAAPTVTVQAGVVSAQLDDWLATRGYGLPVIGSHNDITVGGFASVGGVSPASHRFGLFVDTVEWLEYVDWAGEVVTCSRTERPDHFHRVLTGTGQHGVITALTCRVIPIDKYRTILENTQVHYRDIEGFIEGAGRALADPGDALLARGIWIDFPPRGRSGRSLGLGQFSSYHPTATRLTSHLRSRAAYGYYHGIGFAAGHAPARAAAALKYLGTVGVLLSPKYGSIKHIEIDTDKTLDSTIGDPTRWLVMLAPLPCFASLFRRAYSLVTDFRRRHCCLTFIAVYVKGIRSPYLAQGKADQRFCEMILHLGIDRRGMTPAILDELVSRLDDLCIEEGAFRYMHSKTVADPQRRRRLDPNWFYASAELPVGGALTNLIEHTADRA